MLQCSVSAKKHNVITSAVDIADASPNESYNGAPSAPKGKDSMNGKLQEALSKMQALTQTVAKLQQRLEASEASNALLEEQLESALKARLDPDQRGDALKKKQ